MIPLIGVHLLGTLPACLTATSSELSTGDISAEMVLSSDGETTHIRAVLREGATDSHTYVQVSGEDQLSIDDGFRPLQLKEESLGTYFYYTQDVSTQDPGTLFRVAFERASDAGAPDSTVTLPAAFELVPLPEDTTVSRSKGSLELAWEPASPGDPMHLTLSGSCIEKVELDLAMDEGSRTFAPGSIPSLTGTEQESCKLTATLTRSREGVPDARWGAGSTILAHQQRSLSLVLDP